MSVRSAASIGHVRARADGDADVGLGQGRGVVDAVADHAHALTLGLETLDLPRLVLGPHLGQTAVYAELPGDGPGGAAVVAGEHGDLQPQGVQSLDGLPGLLAHDVRHRYEAGGPAVHGYEHRGLAARGQLLAPGD
jgi:hypothetical protein